MPKVIPNPVHEEELQLYPKKTGEFVAVSGDTMTGDLVFPEGGFIMTDSSDNQWTVTMNTSGELVISSGAITSGILTELSEFLLTENDYNLIQE